MHKIILFILLSVTLVGCMPYKSTFQCPNVYNGKCVTVEQAYEESINKDGQTTAVSKDDSKSVIKQEQNRPDDSYQAELTRKLTTLLQEPETPLMAPPKAIRVLVPAYAEGDQFFMTRYIFLIVDEAKWVLENQE